MVHVLLAVIYISFISLGLPDSLLGSAWPMMHVDFGVPMSWAGAISMIIAVGTVVSSLMSDRLTRRLGTGRVMAYSVAMTALALFGFSITRSFWLLCLWAIPYGLGAGSVDAALNNYVALHYASRHMSWLHCMWGVGTAVGPYIMGFVLTGGQGWNMGYRYIAILQTVLVAVLLISLPLWKGRSTGSTDADSSAPLRMGEIVRIRGAKPVMLMFFCYCALEQTAMLWGSSYLVEHVGLTAERAASLASLFCLGITAGRGVSGFLTFKLNDAAMIRLGEVIITVGVTAMLLPIGEAAAMAGLILVGLGCAPIYPSVIHSIPDIFGADKSQAIIGVQMASAYVGICVMPPLFGLLAGAISTGLLPVYLLALLVLMAAMHEKLRRGR